MSSSKLTRCPAVRLPTRQHASSISAAIGRPPMDLPKLQPRPLKCAQATPTTLVAAAREPVPTAQAASSQLVPQQLTTALTQWAAAMLQNLFSMGGYGRAASNTGGACPKCCHGTYCTGSSITPLTGEGGSNWACLACGSKGHAHEDQETFHTASTASKIGGVSADPRVPVDVQVDSSVDASLKSGFLPDGTTGVTKHTASSNLDTSFAKCAASSTCHFAGWRYTDTTGDHPAGSFLFAPAAAESARAICCKLLPTHGVAVLPVQLVCFMRRVLHLVCVLSIAAIAAMLQM